MRWMSIQKNKKYIYIHAYIHTYLSYIYIHIMHTYIYTYIGTSCIYAYIYVIHIYILCKYPSLPPFLLPPSSPPSLCKYPSPLPYPWANLILVLKWVLPIRGGLGAVEVIGLCGLPIRILHWKALLIQLWTRILICFFPPPPSLPPLPPSVLILPPLPLPWANLIYHIIIYMYISYIHIYIHI